MWHHHEGFILIDEYFEIGKLLWSLSFESVGNNQSMFCVAWCMAHGAWRMVHGAPKARALNY